VAATSALVGLFVAGAGLEVVYRGYRSNDWPAAPGVIGQTWVVSTKGSHATHTPKVRYSYRVNSREYESSRIKFGGCLTEDRAEATSWVEAHEAGASVRVAYDPDDPSEAVLERGVPGSAWLLPSIGALFVVHGAYLLVEKDRA